MRKQLHGVWINEIRGDDGASVTVTDHGAHVLSWIPAGGEEVLYLSERSGYGGNAAIRGGVPIIFPQFGERGNGKRHGFARTAPWRIEFAGVENGQAIARYALNDADLQANAWPHRFGLQYTVAAHGDELRMTLAVANPSSEPWEFNAALHSYWRVGDIEHVRVSGLKDLAYIDQVAQGTRCVQHDDTLRIEDEIDRIYENVLGGMTGNIELSDGQRIVMLRHEGFRDAVVWNPGSEKAASLADLTPGGYKSFLCIEAGTILQPVRLAPGESWQGSQTVRVRKVRKG
jgi:glucose-6-phosphate 1-epimerase